MRLFANFSLFKKKEKLSQRQKKISKKMQILKNLDNGKRMQITPLACFPNPGFNSSHRGVILRFHWRRRANTKAATGRRWIGWVPGWGCGAAPGTSGFTCHQMEQRHRFDPPPPEDNSEAETFGPSWKATRMPQLGWTPEPAAKPDREEIWKTKNEQWTNPLHCLAGLLIGQLKWWVQFLSA